MNKKIKGHYILCDALKGGLIRRKGVISYIQGCEDPEEWVKRVGIGAIA